MRAEIRDLLNQIFTRLQKDKCGLHVWRASRSFSCQILIKSQMGLQSCSKTEDCQWIMTCISVCFSYKYCGFKCQINRIVFCSSKFILVCCKERKAYRSGTTWRWKMFNYGWTNHLINLLGMQVQSSIQQLRGKSGNNKLKWQRKLISLLLFNELGEEQIKSLEQENLLCEESHYLSNAEVTELFKNRCLACTPFCL